MLTSTVRLSVADAQWDTYWVGTGNLSRKIKEGVGNSPPYCMNTYNNGGDYLYQWQLLLKQLVLNA